jgi:hypothetical protein
MRGFRLRVVVVVAAAGAALLCVTGATSAPRAIESATLADASPISSVPSTTEGKTNGAGVSKNQPAPSCVAVRGVVWYTVKAPRRGAMAATLEAGGKLDGAISVVRVLRTQQHEIVCAETDAKGRAAVAWQAYEDGSYLIGVGRQAQSPNGPFRLTVEAAEPQPSPPGEALPAGGTQSTVNPILDTADAWAVQMARGTTYRINLTASGHCLTLEVYRPGSYSFRHVEPVRSSSCGGYVAFTPGLDGGGLYSLVVRAEGTASVAYPYHLQSAPYELDDGAPGIELASGEWAAGTLDGRGIDVVDLYHFTVPRPHQLTAIDLEEKANVGFDVVVLHEDGGRVACACDRKGRQVLRQTLVPGRYFVAVRSRHKSSGAYRLQVVTRDVTTTSISVNGAAFYEAPAGASVPLTVHVTSASHGGRVQIEIDRLDPLFGWQFASVLTGNVDAGGTFVANWTPPWVGFWRARARYLGTPYSNFSESADYVRIHVVTPLE